MTNKIIQLSDGSVETQETSIYLDSMNSSPLGSICPNCGRMYIPEIWISINGDLRPICPHCEDP